MSEPKEVATTVIINEKNEVLILQRGKNSPGAGTWNFPGGGVEEGETAKQAAIREVKEETDLELDSDQLFYLGTLHFKYLTLNVFITQYFAGQITINKESQDFKWVSLDQINDFNFVGGGTLNQGLLKDIKTFINQEKK